MLVKKLDLKIFPSSVFLIAASSLVEAVLYYEKKLNVRVGDYANAYALTLGKGGSHIYILVDINDKNIIPHLVHECTHAALDCMYYAGLDISHANSETICYINDHIFETFYKVITNEITNKTKSSARNSTRKRSNAGVPASIPLLVDDKDSL